MKGSRLMQIQKRIIQKELKYENVVVLKYHIEYPRITNESNNIPSMKFNIYNEQIAKQIQRKAENELYKEAVELYKYNKKNHPYIFSKENRHPQN